MVGARGFEPPTPCAKADGRKLQKQLVFKYLRNQGWWRVVEICGTVVKLEASYKIIYSSS
jgi:hypothetical protein